MIGRRGFLLGLIGLLLAPRGRARAAGLPEAARDALKASPYVYVSPLRSDGGESRCHGEVWFGWLEGAVVVITAKDRWKARAVAGGLDRARIWVGDHGRWKRMGVTNEDFRKAPHFDVRARRVEDPAVLEGLMATFERKYPEEFPKWRDRMRGGFASGDRHIIAYTPIS